MTEGKQADTLYIQVDRRQTRVMGREEEGAFLGVPSE